MRVKQKLLTRKTVNLIKEKGGGGGGGGGGTRIAKHQD